MAYKPKRKQTVKPDPKSNPEKSDSGEDFEQTVVETEIETHPIADDVPFSQKASQKLAGILGQAMEGDDIPASDDKPKKKYYYNSYARKREKERQSELANLITSVLVIAITAVPMRDSLKPNDDEVGALSIRVANIMWRHNWLTGKLSGDALDIIAILAVSASYWQRIRPELQQLRIERVTQSNDVYEQINNASVEHPSPIDPYLDRLVAESETSE